LREGSGGDGLHKGGEGVIREVEVSLASSTHLTLSET
jgi:N-methylhydantoinase B/oxoprolinase/acetone carboxylase alpha subunit